MSQTFPATVCPVLLAESQIFFVSIVFIIATHTSNHIFISDLSQMCKSYKRSSTGVISALCERFQRAPSAMPRAQCILALKVSVCMGE